MTACPRCGSEMAAGYLGTQKWPTGLEWYREVSEFGFRVGEPVATIAKFQMEFLSGDRCEACRLMLLSY